MNAHFDENARSGPKTVSLDQILALDQKIRLTAERLALESMDFRVLTCDALESLFGQLQFILSDEEGRSIRAKAEHVLDKAIMYGRLIHDENMIKQANNLKRCLGEFLFSPEEPKLFGGIYSQWKPEFLIGSTPEEIIKAAKRLVNG